MAFRVTWPMPRSSLPILRARQGAQGQTPEALVAGKDVKPMIDRRLSRHRILMGDQGAFVVEQHFLLHTAVAAVGALRRTPTSRRRPLLHRVPRAAECRRDVLRTPPTCLQCQHRRYCFRQVTSFRQRGAVPHVVRGQFSMAPDTYRMVNPSHLFAQQRLLTKPCRHDTYQPPEKF